MHPPASDDEDLLRRAGGGDADARARLLSLYRERLRQMVAVRLDRRLAARVDPSDVVQEALADACVKLSHYLRGRPLPFYPWLRELALERLVALHRRHVRAEKRSVTREEAAPDLPDESVLELAGRLAARGSTPSQHVVREELRARVQRALLELAPGDRELLVMRHLEQMSMAEIAAVLGVTEGAAKVRHLRALQRVRKLLEGPAAAEGGAP
jgi:RNA polymerase sigma-70 factor (ECF subfamily)